MRVETSTSCRYQDFGTEEPVRLGPTSTPLLEPCSDERAPEGPPVQPEGEGGGLWRFLGDLLDAIGSVAENVIDCLFGIGRSVAGLFRNPSQVPGELLETVSGVAILVGGKAVSTIQTLVGLEPAGRRLTDEEVTALRRIFGGSIDLGRVRIKEGDAGVFSVNDRAFVHGNVIYTKDEPVTLELLAHELVHVWQYQNGGPDYLVEALAAQTRMDAYNWEKAAHEGKTWKQLNPEQQAELVKAAFLSGYFNGGELEPNRTFVVCGVDYASFLREALAELRAGRGTP